VPVTTSKDRFDSIVKALGEMQGEHQMRGELLRVVCQLVDTDKSSGSDPEDGGGSIAGRGGQKVKE
jgi:hypothetical protein